MVWHLPNVVVIELQILDAHVEFLKAPVGEVSELGVGDVEYDPVVGGEMSLKKVHHLFVRVHTFTINTGEMGEVHPAGAGHDVLPYGAVRYAGGDAEHREQERRHRRGCCGRGGHRGGSVVLLAPLLPLYGRYSTDGRWRLNFLV